MTSLEPGVGGRTPGRGGGGRDGRRPVAVLGATGAVGQTFVRLLAAHPWFELTEVAASERSAGRRYGDAAHWLEGELPAAVAALTVLPCDPAAVRATIVFSALDATIAAEVEPAFARAGRLVLSNARSFRMDPDVPLVIPEVNPEQLGLLGAQRTARGWAAGGGIVTNANCAATVAAMALAPLRSLGGGLERVFVTTMQAVSGAGYPGVASLDILGNVIPFIAEEEDKIERELPKLLGGVANGVAAPAAVRVSAHANRVAVEHGHTMCLSIGFHRPVTVEEVKRAVAEWAPSEMVRGLPSAPARALVLAPERDRPQPRRDVMAGSGMSVVIGRVRADPLLHIRLVAMGHNTIRGAAGGSVLNAELLVASGAVSA